jgi:hypothetical protein
MAKNGIEYQIIEMDAFEDHYYCGYCTIPISLVPHSMMNPSEGDFTNIRVHGGVTYVKLKPNGLCVGFDCAHWHSFSNPKTRDLEWLKAECENMAKQVIAQFAKGEQ